MKEYDENEEFRKPRKTGRRPNKVTKKQSESRPPGRPRRTFEFHEAREMVRAEKIGSVAQYKRWWEYNTPARIPKRPDRSYKNDWISWNDFLGTSNDFPFTRKKCRPFKEARSYVQQLGLRNKTEYIAYAKTNKKPPDIPSRPDLFYKSEWFTWKDFLGADVASVKRNVETADGIFFIIQNENRPSNVYQLGITLEGKETIIQAQKTQRFKIVGLYYCEIELEWEPVANAYGRTYWESGRTDEYVVPNINEFIFSMSDFVEKVP